MLSDNPIFVPPFLGSRVAKGISIDEISDYLNQHGALSEPVGLPARDTARTTPPSRSASPRPCASSSASPSAQDLLVPQVVWGHFAGRGRRQQTCVLYTDDTAATERSRFHFPRQRRRPTCASRTSFAPSRRVEQDYASFMLVTMGSRVSERCQELFEADAYMDYLMLHGLGVEMAEALAELWHQPHPRGAGLRR